nr:hypothetical protein [Tanacetum cinerariifolium]
MLPNHEEGEQVGRGGRGKGPRGGNDDHVDELNAQGNDQGIGANGALVTKEMLNQNGNVVNENVQENIRNVLVNGNRVCCSYKEFLANPKEYDGKGCVVVLTRYIKKMKFVQDMSGCSIDQKVKYIVGSFMEEFCPSHEIQKLETELWNHAMVRVSHVAYTDRFHELARLLGMDQLIRLTKEEIWRNLARIRMDCRDVPRNVNPVNAKNPIVKACYECDSTDDVRTVCPRLNRAQVLRGNCPNQVVANNGGQGHENQ